MMPATRFPPPSALVPTLLAVLLGACAGPPPDVQGTLERDRITLPAPASERVIEVYVAEGENVAEGQPLLRLDDAQARARVAAAEAEAGLAREALRELEAGPRSEEIARAEAQLAGARAGAREAEASHARIARLREQGLASAAEEERARAARDEARAAAAAASALRDQLRHGSRSEEVARAEAALAAAEARAELERVLLGKLHLAAPRAGRVDALPWKPGDQAPTGSPLAVLLVGEAPYARLYVPAPQRAHLAIGDPVTVLVEGHARALAGRVRVIRDEPVFTPYYALTGADAARLSYIVEVALDTEAACLPPGLPVRARLPEAPR